MLCVVMLMKLIRGGKRTASINEQDWRFVQQGLNQCLVSGFITEAERRRIMEYLETNERVEVAVKSLMTGSRSVNSFILSLLQAADDSQLRNDS
jgi:thymidylate synthase ThyX